MDTESPMGDVVDFLMSLEESIDDEVLEDARLHLLDTAAAIVSGMVLPPGRAGLTYVASVPQLPQARPIGVRSELMSVRSAALVNAMAAHADETDDSHEASRTHPGCSIVPVVLSLGEHRGTPGRTVLAAVAAGYELCGRVPRAIWPDPGDRRGRGLSTHTIGGLFGSLGGVGVLAGLDEDQWRTLFAYGAQRASGVRTYLRCPDHVEKAYAFGAMGATTALELLEYVHAGWTGVDDAFAGQPNLFGSFNPANDPSVLSQGLGTEWVVAATNIKRHPVGSPIQAPVEATREILGRHPILASDVVEVEVILPPELAEVVTDRDMPNVNVRYCVAVTILDGDLSFAAVHDDERFAQWAAAPPFTVKVVPDPSMERRRQARVRMTTTGGDELEAHVDGVRGTVDNPMTATEIEAKAHDLLAPVLGENAARTAVNESRRLAESDGLERLAVALRPTE